MPKLTTMELAALKPREYIGQVRSRLRDNEAWADVLAPELMPRTQWALGRIIASIDEQKVRVAGSGIDDPDWLIRVNSLRRYTKMRLEQIAPADSPYIISGTKEAKAWRAFSARLARALASGDVDAIYSINPPYTDLSTLEWLDARDAKRKVGK